MPLAPNTTTISTTVDALISSWLEGLPDYLVEEHLPPPPPLLSPPHSHSHSYSPLRMPSKRKKGRSTTAASSPTVEDNSQTTSSSSLSPPRGRKRQRQLSSSFIATTRAANPILVDENDTIDDIISIRSGASSSTALSGRRILKPVALSSRSNSLTKRDFIPVLRRATPSVKICFPEECESPPAHVSSLRLALAVDADSRYIHPGFKSRIESVAPHEIFEIPSRAFTEANSHSESELDIQWNVIKGLLQRSREAEQMDESEWADITRRVFYAAGIHEYSGILRILNIQTQNIHKSYIPKMPADTTISLAKKADLTLAFRQTIQEVADALDPIFEKDVLASISHMADPFTRRIPLVCGVEVKHQAGNKEEAVAQLAVWLAAHFAKLKELKSLPYDQYMPAIGWTVVGSDWMLYISWLDSKGNVIINTPSSLLMPNLRSYHNLFKLLHMIRKTSKWLEYTYWPWYRDYILSNSCIRT